MEFMKELLMLPEKRKGQRIEDQILNEDASNLHKKLPSRSRANQKFKIIPLEKIEPSYKNCS